MSEQNSIVIVALDHITLRWEDKDIDPKTALALGVVMNFQAGQALPELSKVSTDLLLYGAGFYKFGADKLQHIPFHKVAWQQ